MKQLNTSMLFALIAGGIVSGCGGTGAATTNIAGTVSGLSAATSVQLDDNDADPITVSANGNFHFPAQVQAGTPYSVTVALEPLGQSCKVNNGSGVVGQNSGDVNNIAVSCAPIEGQLFGVVSGLAANATLTLQNLDTLFYATVSSTIIVKANGPFAFPTTLQIGSSYNVVVTVQPATQNCVVSNGSGTISEKGTISAIQVLCQ
jgi:hypothetical protein